MFSVTVFYQWNQHQHTKDWMRREVEARGDYLKAAFNRYVDWKAHVGREERYGRYSKRDRTNRPREKRTRRNTQWKEGHNHQEAHDHKVGKHKSRVHRNKTGTINWKLETRRKSPQRRVVCDTWTMKKCCSTEWNQAEDPGGNFSWLMFHCLIHTSDDCVCGNFNKAQTVLWRVEEESSVHGHVNVFLKKLHHRWFK